MVYAVVINSHHVTSLLLTAETLRRAFNIGFVVRTQSPLHLSPHNDPEPDIAVVPGAIRDWTQQHPSTALLVVEVSDATLRYDLGRKASLYARAQILDYWVVDLNNAQLHVLRSPVEDAEAAFGWKYASEQTLSSGDSRAPLAKPDAPVAVSDLLP